MSRGGQEQGTGEAAAQGGCRRPGDLRLGWKARDAHEREGNSWDCSPWTDFIGRMACGGVHGNRRRSNGGGSFPATDSRREGAPWTRLDVAQLRAVAVSPIDASMRRIERWQAASSARLGGGARSAQVTSGETGLGRRSFYRGAAGRDRAGHGRDGRRRRPGLPAWHAMAMASGSDGPQRAWLLGRSGPGWTGWRGPRCGPVTKSREAEQILVAGLCKEEMGCGRGT
jgi:hypothetical protein